MNLAAQEILVELGPRCYPIRIGSGLLGDASSWRALLPGQHVLIVSNDIVAPLYLDRVVASLHGFTVASVILPDGEAHKTLESAARVFAALATMKASRDACIVALGGGVIGDLAGFAAACWMRGIAFVQMPTTLLAMVDSSVGGKTAVDLPQGKNLVGAFHQPRAVITDIETLRTLPERDYRSGLAEIIKHSAVGDATFFAHLETLTPALDVRDAQALGEVIAHSCRFKAGVVARDETEQGERALLNFGHTFAHALETATGYGDLMHGEAVAIGMLLAARLSSRLARAPAADAERLRRLIERCGLPTRVPPGVDAGHLIELMRLDKKNLSGRLRLILWRRIGEAEIVADIADEAIRAVIEEARTSG